MHVSKAVALVQYHLTIFDNRKDRTNSISVLCLPVAVSERFNFSWRHRSDSR